MTERSPLHEAFDQLYSEGTRITLDGSNVTIHHPSHIVVAQNGSEQLTVPVIHAFRIGVGEQLPPILGFINHSSPEALTEIQEELLGQLSNPENGQYERDLIGYALSALQDYYLFGDK